MRIAERIVISLRSAIIAALLTVFYVDQAFLAFAHLAFNRGLHFTIGYSAKSAESDNAFPHFFYRPTGVFRVSTRDRLEDLQQQKVWI